MYSIYEMIGNTSAKVAECDTMYEAERWIKRIIHNVKIDTIKEIF